MNKFKNVPTDEGTTTKFQQEMKFGEYDVLYEIWTWDGVSAECIIFFSEDIIELKDEEIEKQVRASPVCKKESSITISRKSGYTFVNFNFVILKNLINDKVLCNIIYYKIKIFG